MSSNDERQEFVDRLTHLFDVTQKIERYPERMAGYLGLISSMVFQGAPLGSRKPWKNACESAANKVCSWPRNEGWEDHLQVIIKGGIEQMSEEV